MYRTVEEKNLVDVMAILNLGDDVDAKSVIEAHSILRATINQGLNQEYEKLAVTSAFELVSVYGLHTKFLVCELLFYPFLSGIISLHEIRQTFGNSIVELMESVQQITNTFDSIIPTATGYVRRATIDRYNVKPTWDKQTRQIRSEALFSVAKFPGVVLTKLVNRYFLLHWSQKLSLDHDLRELLAHETIDIYAEPAEMLGAWRIKSQLEDAAFEIMEPYWFEKIVSDLEEHDEERRARIKSAIQELRIGLHEHGIENAIKKIEGRAKHIYGIYLKVQRTGFPVAEVNDMNGLRVTVEEAPIINNEREKYRHCYEVLSVIFDIWNKPDIIANMYDGKEYRDWIMKSKPNGYQSIHTTVLYDSKLLEIQIRTDLMDFIANYGFAAHWVYKRVGNSEEEQKKLQESIKQVAQYRQFFERHSGDVSKLL